MHLSTVHESDCTILLLSIIKVMRTDFDVSVL